MRNAPYYRTEERTLFPVTDLKQEDMQDMQSAGTLNLLRESHGQMRPIMPPQRFEYLGETPIAGEGAIARWLALYDRAMHLRAELHLQDHVAIHTVRRAVNSLFLYEHQLTGKTRRRARLILWHRDHQEAPAFATRIEWTQCRCWDCQPALWMCATSAEASLPTLLQTA